MDILYLVFAAIPLIAVATVIFPSLSGGREAIPVGGFEYNVYLSKRRIIVGSIGFSASGAIFTLILDCVAPFDARAVLPLLILLASAICFLCHAMLYFCYRLTVRGGVLFFKLPFRRETVLNFSEIGFYRLTEKRSGGSFLRIYVKNRPVIFAESGESGFDQLIFELESRNIAKK